MTDRPSLVKSLFTALLSAGVGWWLFRLPLGSATPVGLQPDSLLQWSRSIDTSTVVFTVVRSVGVFCSAYITLVALVGTLVAASGNARTITRIWGAMATRGLRNTLAVGAITAWAVSPAIVAATDSNPPAIVLIDVGPARQVEPDPDLFTEVSQVEAPPISESLAADVWVVEPGDHLWGIARSVLLRDGPEPTTRAVNSYWRRLITDNHDVVGDNPDLIYPGQLLDLPG